MTTIQPGETADNIVVRDVIIIGAGPCGLAVAARLYEHTPSALFTDEEHARYHWIRKQGVIRDRSSKPKSIHSHGRENVLNPRGSRQYDVLVLDATADQWLARWNQLFKAFNITHLRSPMFFHVDPADRDGLLAYTHARNMEGELKEIGGCVGKEISKHQLKKRTRTRGKRASTEAPIDERDRQDYFMPSQSLFTQHCECIINRYGLRNDLISQQRVIDVSFGPVDSHVDSEQIFTVKTDVGTHYAKSVVLAVGAGGPCSIPCCVADHDPPLESHNGACHSMQITDFPSANVKAKIEGRMPTQIVVVGGGLTAAQLCDLAIRRGVDHVVMLVRGKLKVKPFDVDLAWMGKYKNHEKSVFWSADSDEERLDQIRTARNGGSITPPYHKILKGHIAAGKLTICTDTIIQARTWDQSSQTWHISTTSPSSSSLQLSSVDYIYYATGISSDITSLPYLQSVLKTHPIHQHGGFPCLTDDLMWRKDVPLFVTGKFAGLRLGPGAGNLEGARLGAERIAWALEDMLGLRTEPEEQEGESRDGDHVFNYHAGIGDRFEVLSRIESSE